MICQFLLLYVEKWFESNISSCNSYSAIYACKQKSKYHIKYINFEPFKILHSNFRNLIFQRAFEH